MDKNSALKQYFGHGEFRAGQEEAVDALLSGRDVLAVMPTGAGKSICYQLPALLFSGITLVVSPLISLMKDQVAALSKAGIPSAYINSSLSTGQYREVFKRAEAGAYKIIYITPERLLTADFLQFARNTQISLLAVDEAHCVSQWGQDFRPSYLLIPEFLRELPSRPPLGAFTATATVEVKKDIEKLLFLENPLRVTTGFDRPNLYFEVASPKNKDAYLEEFLAERPEQSGIIYCSTRKAVEQVCENLRLTGISASEYHAGLPDEKRRQNQEDFDFDRIKVMVATNAFGMGIDKSNVSFVVHYNMPKNIESYYQEAGRAGRDGENARCVLLYSAKDIKTARYLIDHGEKNDALSEEEQELKHLQDLKRLDKMIAYCKTTGCLRKFLLEYFGETAPENCGNCGSCLGEFEQQDITVDAQKILSAVYRVEKKYPYGLSETLIVRMLCGSRDKRVMQFGLDEMPTYGIMKGVERSLIRDYIDFLAEEGYLTISEGQYPVLMSTEKAKSVLFSGEKVVFRSLKRTEKGQKTASVKVQRELSGADMALQSRLKELRTVFAEHEHVPAYVIFSNAALSDMAARKPRNREEFLLVSGVGKVKAERYGDAFIEAIGSYLTDGAQIVPDGAQNEPDKSLYQKLKKWRENTARELRKPAFFVLHNSVIENISAAQPENIDALLLVSGIGSAKAEAYGEEILEVVREWKNSKESQE